jgi:hypothetical protein
VSFPFGCRKIAAVLVHAAGDAGCADEDRCWLVPEHWRAGTYISLNIATLSFREKPCTSPLSP